MSKSRPDVSFESWLKVATSFQSRTDIYDLNWETVETSPGTTAEYLIKLFREAPILLADVEPIKVANLIAFFQGSYSSLWWEVRKPEVPGEMQSKAVLALADFYTDFLDTVCDGKGRAPATSTHDLDDLDGIVYMMWDMDCIEGAAMFPGEEHLVDPIFQVLETCLGCKSVACQLSGLHGLNHLEHYHPDRVHTLIKHYLREEMAAKPWLNSYARDAMLGRLI